MLYFALKRRGYTRFKLYPAWNMIGGRRMLKNTSGSKVTWNTMRFDAVINLYCNYVLWNVIDNKFKAKTSDTFH